jgi:hypothetical protein
MYNSCQELYDAFVESIDLKTVTCPKCGSVGTLSRNSDYERYFFNSVHDYQESATLTITVVKCDCDTCNSYHAIFPSWVCPFSNFSYPFVEKIFDHYFNESHENKSQTAAAFSISRKEVYGLLKKLEKNLIKMRQVPEFAQEAFDLAAFFEAARLKRALFLSFLRSFLRWTGHTFLSYPRKYFCQGSWRSYAYGPLGGHSNT